MDVREVKKVLREEMDARGWHQNDWRAGLAAIVGGESAFIPKFESGYANTANMRIRRIFSSRVRGLTDSAITRLKRSDEEFFNYIYGPKFQGIHHLGNTEEDDGFKYRGGGLNQLTGRANYGRYGPKVGVDLLANPELVNVPRIAAAVAVEYMKDRFRGGDFDAMKRAVGVSIGEPDAEKNRLFKSYLQTGEWDYQADTSADPQKGREDEDGATPVEDLDPVIEVFLEALQNAEKFLKEKGLYTGPIDNDPGPGFRAALKAYLRS